MVEIQRNIFSDASESLYKGETDTESVVNYWRPKSISSRRLSFVKKRLGADIALVRKSLSEWFLQNVEKDLQK